VQTLQEELFLLETLGDDRAIAATYVAGERWQVPSTPRSG
jgi:guanine deaminase